MRVSGGGTVDFMGEIKGKKFLWAWCDGWCLAM